MTWHHFLRAMAVAAIAASALAAAQRVQAEGGEAWPEDRERPGVVETAAADPRATLQEGGAAEGTFKGAEAAAGRRAAQLAEAARAAALRPLVVRYASENGVPFELADAVVRVESRYNASARSGPHMGLTQINVRTAESLGYTGPPNGLLDPDTNLRYGLKYLGQAYKLASGDTCGTILRYQGGHRATVMTSQAAAYCARVKTFIAQAE